MLFPSDGPFFLKNALLAIVSWHQRPWQPIHIDAEIMKTPEKKVR